MRSTECLFPQCSCHGRQFPISFSSTRCHPITHNSPTNTIPQPLPEVPFLHPPPGYPTNHIPRRSHSQIQHNPVASRQIQAPDSRPIRAHGPVSSSSRFLGQLRARRRWYQVSALFGTSIQQVPPFGLVWFCFDEIRYDLAMDLPNTQRPFVSRPTLARARTQRHADDAFGRRPQRHGALCAASSRHQVSYSPPGTASQRIGDAAPGLPAPAPGGL
ncbi:hypothetical protein EDC01DRAFT_643284 [Geopyxis carbonaria]|nr:hypothetical protein EDC01DRAFT_643284 [Geopyxis carbonaria]